jgi:hypothetical protein
MQHLLNPLSAAAMQKEFIKNPTRIQQSLPCKDKSKDSRHM